MEKASQAGGGLCQGTCLGAIPCHHVEGCQLPGGGQVLEDQDEPRKEVPLESRHLNARTDLKGDVSVKWEDRRAGVIFVKNRVRR